MHSRSFGEASRFSNKRQRKAILASRAETDERSEDGIYEGLLIPFQKESNFCFKKEHRTARRSRFGKALRFRLGSPFPFIVIALLCNGSPPRNFDSATLRSG